MGTLIVVFPLKGTNDEFDGLSRHLNLMLEQIEKLMGGLRQVSIDMAHDLRTQLSRMRQKLEGARNRARNLQDYDQAIDQALSQNGGILETFSALLEIARSGSGAHRQGFHEVSLGEDLETIEETYAPIAEERHQILFHAIEPDLMMHGDPRLVTPNARQSRRKCHSSFAARRTNFHDPFSSNVRYDSRYYRYGSWCSGSRTRKNFPTVLSTGNKSNDKWQRARSQFSVSHCRPPWNPYQSFRQPPGIARDPGIFHTKAPLRGTIVVNLTNP